MNKLLSIIVPSCDMEAYLPKCLGSLLLGDGELLQRLEVIVVNDGSKDRTGDIAHGFERRRPDVFRVIDKPNGNYGSCVNAALPAASGTYVKILDADDSFDTAGLERLLGDMRGLVGDRCADLVLTDFDWVDAGGTVIRRTRQAMPPDRVIPCREIRRFDTLYMHAMAYRTDFLRQTGYRQTEGVSYTDNEWACIPIAEVESVYYCPYTVYRYLCGRAGQTVDPKVSSRRWPMKVTVARRLLESYGAASARRDRPGCDYVCGYVESFVERIYRDAILWHPSGSADAGLRDFDDWLSAEFPALHGRMFSDRLKDRRLHLPYGAWWRSGRSSFCPRLRALRSLMKAYSWLRNFLGR